MFVALAVEILSKFLLLPEENLACLERKQDQPYPSWEKIKADAINCSFPSISH